MIGGCLCGQVRYAVKGEPESIAVCHCKNCQRQSGTAFSVVVGVPRDALTVQGETRTFVDMGDSGHPVERVFCPACGSPLYSTTRGRPARAYVKAGTLDDTDAVAPTTTLYGGRMQRWLCDIRFDPTRGP